MKLVNSPKIEFVCPECSSKQVTEIVIGNNRYFKCENCQDIKEKVLTIDSRLETIATTAGIKHLSAGALVEKDGKILLIKRRSYMFGYAFPAGHIEKDESPKNAVIRELMEETGLEAQNAKLIFHGEIENDSCKYGADIHEWFLFKCEVTNTKIALNQESELWGWYTPKEALNLPLIPAAKFIIEKVIKSKTPSKTLSQNKKDKQEMGIIPERKDNLIFHLSSMLTGENDIENILEVAATETLSAINAFSVSIALADKSNQTLQIKTFRSYSGKKAPENIKSFEVGEGIAGKCAKERKPIAVSNVTQCPFYLNKNKDFRGAILCIPLVANGVLLGVISISEDKPRNFTEEEVELLMIMSNIIAMSIQNSYLFSKTAQKLENTQKLFSIASTTEPGHVVVRKMLQILPDLFESEKAHLLLKNHELNILEPFAVSDKNTKEAIETMTKKVNLNKRSFSGDILSSGLATFSNDVVNDKRFYSRKFQSSLGIKSILSVPIKINEKNIGVLHVMNNKFGGFTTEDIKLGNIVATRIGTIVENYRLLEETRVEKNRLDNIISSISEGVVVIDKNDRIVVWNGYMEGVGSITREEAKKQSGSKALATLGLKNLAKIVNEFISSSKVSSRFIEDEIHLQDESITIGSSVSLTKNIFDQSESLVLVLRDTSKDKELMKAKNELISTATHELRTPLTAIKGYLSMLLAGDAGELGSKQKKYAEKAATSTERLVGLVEELLTVLRIEERKINVNPENIDLGKIVAESYENFKKASQNKDIDLKLGKANNLYAYADSTRTRQIIDNLIDNALKYTPSGGSVEISIEGRANDVIISVSDTGVGIPEKSLTTIFERFVRVENPLSISAGGTGLGLFIVKNLVEKQGGKVWAKNNSKKGTTFYFTLPSPVVIKNN